MTDSSQTDRLFDDAEPGDIAPMAVFEDWLQAARTSEINDPGAMAMASVDADGLPDVRMVLLNGHDARGFVFFTNFGSAKGRQLLSQPRAALVLHWKSLRRQVRVRGPVEEVTNAEADAYFGSRPRGSQIASSASLQSQPLVSRAELEARVAALSVQLGEGSVERPARWSGFRVVPLQIEFWKDGAFRLHDRVQFTRPDVRASWTRQRLFP